MAPRMSQGADVPREEGYLKIPGTENPGLERGPDGRMRKKAPVVAKRSGKDKKTLLESMQHVADNEDTDQDTQREAGLRRWLDDDPRSFFAKIADLEGKRPGVQWDGKSPCPVCKREPEGVDMGHERIKQLRKDFLREMGMEDRSSGG